MTIGPASRLWLSRLLWSTYSVHVVFSRSFIHIVSSSQQLCRVSVTLMGREADAQRDE